MLKSIGKYIPLTQGKYAIVDQEDYESLKKYNWYYANMRNYEYALRHCKKKESSIRGSNIGRIIFMHREIMNVSDKGKSVYVDHQNHKGLDNRKSNLKVCSNSINQLNVSKKITSKNDYIGVKKSRNGSFQARIRYAGKRIHLGTYKTEYEAHLVYMDYKKKILEEYYKN